jgi:hypothetical protein
MVDVGVSYRPGVPYRMPDSVNAVGTQVVEYRYVGPWGANASVTNSLELSLSLKYVP